MTDQKLSQLTAVTTLAVTDIVYAVASSNSRKITVANAGKYITPITTQGDLVVGDGTSAARLALGSANKLLGSDGTDALYLGGMELQTGAYTILASEHMKVFRVINATTITLPTYSDSGDFFQCSVINVGSATVTLKGDGAEIIRAPGGARNTVTLPSLGDHITVVNGANWETMSLRATFESAEQSITDGANHTVAHNLGVQPHRVETFIRNKTTELGFSVGDEVPIAQAFNDGTSDYNITTTADTGDIVMTVGVDGIRVARQTATIGELTAITNGSWRLVARASV